MRAYSYDLRQRILHAVDQGKPRAEISKMFAHLTSHEQAVSQAETRDWRLQTQNHSRASGKERCSPACRTTTATRYLPRCNACGTLSALGNHPEFPGKHCDDEPGDPAPGLDAEEKDIARERTKGSRSHSLARTGLNIRCEQAHLYR
jgi:hypothetical protein